MSGITSRRIAADNYKTPVAPTPLRACPPLFASFSPVSLKSASNQPQKRFSWFQLLSPWRISTNLKAAMFNIALQASIVKINTNYQVDSNSWCRWWWWWWWAESLQLQEADRSNLCFQTFLFWGLVIVSLPGFYIQSESVNVISQPIVVEGVIRYDLHDVHWFYISNNLMKLKIILLAVKNSDTNHI